MVPEAGEHCHVALLDLYFSKVPSEALEDNFYLRPLQKKSLMIHVLHGLRQCKLVSIL